MFAPVHVEFARPSSRLCTINRFSFGMVQKVVQITLGVVQQMVQFALGVVQKMVQIAHGTVQKTVQIAPWMVHKVVLTRCNLHLCLHLRGAKRGANEVHFTHIFATTWCKQWYT